MNRVPAPLLPVIVPPFVLNTSPAVTPPSVERLPAITYWPAPKFTFVLLLPLMFNPPKKVKVEKLPPVVTGGHAGSGGAAVLVDENDTLTPFPMLMGRPVGVFTPPTHAYE